MKCAIGGLSIKYVRKISRKTNISNPLIRTRSCAYQGVRMLVFRKILRTYLMDGPLKKVKIEIHSSWLCYKKCFTLTTQKVSLLIYDPDIFQSGKS